MTLALGILAAAATLASPPVLDPQALPQLAARGFAQDMGAEIRLETMGGRPLGVLRGLGLAPDKTVSHQLLMRDRRGRLFVLDHQHRRVRRYFEAQPVSGCRMTDARIRLELFVCKRTVRTAIYGPPGSKPELRVVARAPGEVGHWVWAAFSPRGRDVLAQWSAECEVPIAFLVSRGVMRPYGGRTMAEAPESMALGWLPDGSAVIHFPKGACGGSFHRPGIYAVPRAGRARLLLGTPRFGLYSMWGG
jgi:hypothetical protein